MLSQVFASPCLWVSKHFPGYQGYFMSGFIGYFAFSGKQFTSNSLFPISHKGENTTPLVTDYRSLSLITQWFFCRFICQSSCDGHSVCLVFYTKVEHFFPLSTWEWLGNPPACVLLATALQWAGCWGKTSAWLKSSWLWEMLWFCPGMEVLIKKVLRVASWET